MGAGMGESRVNTSQGTQFCSFIDDRGIIEMVVILSFGAYEMYAFTIWRDVSRDPFNQR